MNEFFLKIIIDDRSLFYFRFFIIFIFPVRNLIITWENFVLLFSGIFYSIRPLRSSPHRIHTPLKEKKFNNFFLFLFLARRFFLSFMAQHRAYNYEHNYSCSPSPTSFGSLIGIRFFFNHNLWLFCSFMAFR